MQQYDATLKLLLKGSGASMLARLSGVNVARWLDAEMQQVSVSRADLLGESANGEMLHVELQASNDSQMALRMAEYLLSIYRQFGRFPKQIVLYVGEAKMRMDADLSCPDLAFRYALIDFREFNSEELLASSHIQDNLLAVLARPDDLRETVRQVLVRIAGLEEAERVAALAQFLIISGLRRLGHTVKEEALKMPILNDILDHDLLGPLILQGRQEGLQEGKQEGLQEGKQEGLREMFVRMLEERLGKVPERVEDRISKLSPEELLSLTARAVHVASYEELFPAG